MTSLSSQPAHPDPTPTIVTLHALSCGHFTLPEHQFVKPSSLDARRTVPSLAFLIQHTNKTTNKTTRIMFDLGLRRDLNQYPLPIQKHIENRRPITVDPDVTKNLAKGGLTPDDIDYVIFSHVHWDHVGQPHDFPTSTFIVGHGARALLAGSNTSLRGGHSFFEPDLLPPDRSIELSNPNSPTPHHRIEEPGTLSFDRPWNPHPAFPLLLPQTFDLFNDTSLFIINAPGHLPGHINLLARTSQDHYVYLGGDACHDRRLLTGEKGIGEWVDGEGVVCCIHADRREAERTIERIARLEREGVEVVFAHDVGWEGEEENRRRFFGAGEG